MSVRFLQCIGIARYVSLCQSVCVSVCHKLVLFQNYPTSQDQDVFTINLQIFAEAPSLDWRGGIKCDGLVDLLKVYLH